MYRYIPGTGWVSVEWVEKEMTDTGKMVMLDGRACRIYEDDEGSHWAF
jgi:hypothetical protein